MLPWILCNHFHQYKMLPKQKGDILDLFCQCKVRSPSSQSCSCHATKEQRGLGQEKSSFFYCSEFVALATWHQFAAPNPHPTLTEAYKHSDRSHRETYHFLPPPQVTSNIIFHPFSLCQPKLFSWHFAAKLQSCVVILSILLPETRKHLDLCVRKSITAGTRYRVSWFKSKWAGAQFSNMDNDTGHLNLACRHLIGT